MGAHPPHTINVIEATRSEAARSKAIDRTITREISTRRIRVGMLGELAFSLPCN
jgi:hypothetical protein